MAHHCKNLLILCMDFRLNGEVDKWIKDSGLLEGGYDLLSIAGAGKRIAEGETEIFEDIAVSCDLHQAQKVILMHHSDCGAYAKDYDFSSPQEEKEKQIEDMNKAEAKIKARYPHLEVIKVWAELKDKGGKEIEFEVL